MLNGPFNSALALVSGSQSQSKVTCLEQRFSYRHDFAESPVPVVSRFRRLYANSVSGSTLASILRACSISKGSSSQYPFLRYGFPLHRSAM